MIRSLNYHATCSFVVMPIIFLLSIPCQSTTAIVIVSSNGIVIAMDSKQAIAKVSNGKIEQIGDREGKKALIIKGRFAISSINHESFSLRAGTLALDYNFSTWTRDIERSLPDDVSFDVFVGVVQAELRKVARQIEPFVNIGVVDHYPPWNMLDAFAYYPIVGYEDGSPRLTVLDFYVDWESNTIRGPYQSVVEPSQTPINSVSPNNRIYFFGVYESAVEISVRDSYAYKRAMARCPKALQDLISNRSLTLDESAALSAVLVSIEEETNPDVVNGSVHITTIRPTGRASTKILSKANSRTHKQSQ